MKAQVERFLTALGFSDRVTPGQGERGPAARAVSGYEPHPYVTEGCRRNYGLFLDSDYPRAHAISADGHCGYAYGGEDPKKRAIAYCERRAKEPCKLYAVDNTLLWQQAQQ